MSWKYTITGEKVSMDYNNAKQETKPNNRPECGELRGPWSAVEARQSLAERIASQLDRSGREARKLEALNELSFLLQKNPEVARILDLMEAVREY